MQIIKSFEDKNVRVKIVNDEPYFVAADVCKILDIKNTKQAIDLIDQDGVSLGYTIDSMGRQQKVNYVDESGLYQLIFKSNKKEAKEFKRWVTKEVLPEIRKTGKYSLPEKLRKDSIESRKTLTSEWQKHGIENPDEFRRLTIEEYRALEFEKGKRKKDFDKSEILRLHALEAMESLKLYYNYETIGYDNCKDSLNDTAETVKLLSKNKQLESDPELNREIQQDKR